MSETKTMTVERVEPEAWNRRTVLYGSDPNYQVIADIPHPGINLGDVVEYEPCGVNFGFLVVTDEMRKPKDV